MNLEIAEELGTSRQTVGLWRQRFSDQGLSGIEKDAPRGGRPSHLRKDLEALIIRKTTQDKPKSDTHWSTRSLAKELGITHSMVHRVWNANGLKPHRTKTFKVSNDPEFEAANGQRSGMPSRGPESPASSVWTSESGTVRWRLAKEISRIRSEP